MEGNQLIDRLIKMSGLPPEWATNRLNQIISQQGINVSAITLDQLRVILVELVSDSLLEAKEDLFSLNDKSKVSL